MFCFRLNILKKSLFFILLITSSSILWGQNLNIDEVKNTVSKYPFASQFDTIANDTIYAELLLKK